MRRFSRLIRAVSTVVGSRPASRSGRSTDRSPSLSSPRSAYSNSSGMLCRARKFWMRRLRSGSLSGGCGIRPSSAGGGGAKCPPMSPHSGLMMSGSFFSTTFACSTSFGTAW